MSVPGGKPSGGIAVRIGVSMLLAAAVGACGGSAQGTPPTSSRPVATAQVVSTPSAGTATPTPAPLPSATALTLLWQKSEPKARTSADTATYWPAIDPATGNVWVSSPWENDFWIFKPDGTFVETWGTGGTGNGQFHLTTNDQLHPDADGAVAFAPDGSFYVSDGGNDRIQQFDAHRHFVRAWGSFGDGDGQFAAPKGIATDGKTVFVADDDRLDMQTFDASGTHLATFDFPFVLFSLMPDGDLVVTDDPSETVQEFDPKGNQIAEMHVDFAGLGGVASMPVADKAGDLYVGIQTESDGPVGLVKLDATGHVLEHWTAGAETLALSPDEHSIYMAYTGPPTGYGWPYLRKYALP